MMNGLKDEPGPLTGQIGMNVRYKADYRANLQNELGELVWIVTLTGLESSGNRCKIVTTTPTALCGELCSL